MGAAALAFPGRAADTDPTTGRPLPPQDNGLQAHCDLLAAKYGEDDQVCVRDVIDTFLDLRRGRLSLSEYLNEHEFTFEEAARIGGLGLNSVGRTHLLL